MTYRKEKAIPRQTALDNDVLLNNKRRDYNYLPEIAVTASTLLNIQIVKAISRSIWDIRIMQEIIKHDEDKMVETCDKWRQIHFLTALK